MNRPMQWMMWLVVGLALLLALASGRAFGEVIDTGTAAASAQAADARERVRALASRPELEKQLQALGIAPGDAGARVDAMSDAEVLALAGRLDALPAGGALTNEQVLILVLAILLLVVLL